MDEVVTRGGFVLCDVASARVEASSPRARLLLGWPEHSERVAADRAWEALVDREAIAIPSSDGECLCCTRQLRGHDGEERLLLIQVARTAIDGRARLLVALVDLQEIVTAQSPACASILRATAAAVLAAPSSNPALSSTLVECDFSESTLVDRVMGDLDLARVVAETFLEDIRQRLGVLERCTDGADHAALTLQVHTIKGAAANVGAEALARFAARFEAALSQNTTIDYGEWIEQLARRYARAHERIVASAIMKG